MDVQTAYRHILTLTHKETASTDQAVQDSVMRALAESMKFNRSQLTHFNNKSVVIELDESHFGYELPSDYIGLIGDVMYCASLTDNTAQYPLIQQDSDWLNQLRGVDVSYTTDPKRDVGAYAIDDRGERIYVAGPSTGFIKIRYIADLGTITYKHDGTNWVFYQPFTETAITTSSTYTNLWLKDGYDAIVHRACYYLFTRDMGGTEATNNKALVHLTQWDDAMKHLTRETTKKKSLRRIRMWI